MSLASRLGVFIRERFPVGPSFVGAALLALAADRVGGALLGRTVGLDRVGLAGVVLVMALFLVLRVADEVFDLEEDRLAWPARPLSRGAVSVADVVVLAVIAVVAAGAVAAVAVGVVGVVVVVAVVAAMIALQRDLGVDAIRRRPLLSLTVHQLMVPLWVLAVVSLRDPGVVATPGRWPLPVMALALVLSLLFELGRKTRHPADEVPHDESWSGLLGVGGAVALITLVAGAGALVTFVIVHTLTMPVWVVVVPALAFAWVIGVALLTPRRRGRLLELSTALASAWVYLPLLLATA